MSQLDFEKPILELEGKIAELRNVSGENVVHIAEEISRMEEKSSRLLKQAYGKLTPAQKVQVARHQNRPHCSDYIKALIPRSGNLFWLFFVLKFVSLKCGKTFQTEVKQVVQMLSAD